MQAEIQCRGCGRPVPKRNVEGLCPTCLMQVALGPKTEALPEEELTEDSQGQQIGFVPPSLEELGRLFPQFEFVELLGQGGMGAVYKARQRVLDRWVALKVLPPRPAERPDFAQRFIREARAMARLNHPGIVAVYEFGQAGRMPYLVMEYVHGVSLRRLVSEGRLPPAEALRIVPQICEALQYAHEEGVVHRDIKPENILIDKKGRVKIADFGIAKLVDGSGVTARLTAERQVVGTPHYMAPEQVEHPQSVDHRADIYSLGVVFYEMLTGELPLGKFAPPSSKAPVSRRMDQVVLQALEKEPERRYQQAREVKTAVETISVDHQLEETAPPGTRAAKGAANLFWWGGAGAVGLAVALLLTAWFQSPSTRQKTNLAAPAARENSVFPADAGVVDVTQPPYNAKGDGQTDATSAIQRALTDFAGKHAVIYLPNGIYLVSQTLRWGSETNAGASCSYTTLQGQSRDGTMIRLKTGCAGFHDPQAPQPVICTGRKRAEGYQNSIRNLTVDTGTNNPGAIGVQFNANLGCLRNVRIRSGDGQGVTGLDMSFVDEIGPLLVKRLTISGFKIGIHTKQVLSSQTFEQITLQDQTEVGFLNEGQTVSIRGLMSSGSVPVFRNDANVGLAVIIDAQLNGHGGAEGHAAILNRCGLFVRNLKVNGFGLAIAHSGTAPATVAGPFVEEWTSTPLSDSPPSLGLPVKETPEVPWGSPGEWVSAVAYGASPGSGGDDSGAIQRAIDSGKGTVYLPRGEYTVRHPIQLRGKVRRLIGCSALLRVELHSEAGPLFILGEGEAPVVVIERIVPYYGRDAANLSFIDNRSARTLVLCDTGGGDSDFTGPGEVFLENVEGRMTFHGQRVWARQSCQGTREGAPRDERYHLRNHGGQLWILGGKTIGSGPVVTTTRGGRTELLGALLYSSAGALEQLDPAFVVEDASLSVSINEVSYRNFHYPVLVRHIAQGKAADVLLPEQARGGINASLIPCFTTR